MLVKILVLHRIYNLSDDQNEYQINDRKSFMRFIGLGPEDCVPDAKTIWRYRDTLTKANIIRELFNQELEKAGLITYTGTVVDATFVEAPRQHNYHDENQDIKQGKTPEEWQGPVNIHKPRQKDVDDRWTRTGNYYYYGYNDHVKADADS